MRRATTLSAGVLALTFAATAAAPGCNGTNGQSRPASATLHGSGHSHATRSTPSTNRSSPSDAISPIDHPIATQSEDARRHFNDALAYHYGFNHDEAVAQFRKAAAADPRCAMAHWGEALALGWNYNEWTITPERHKAAYDAVQRAAELAKDGPEHERAYVAALAKRYSADPEKADPKQLALAYHAAMGELSRKYPDDLDAATLYADAAMNLRPWKLYTPDNEPVKGTAEIVATLESVMRRDPDHIGALHLYIHAVEASKHPERALEASGRLPGLAPTLGHLVHMPSHIYSRVGDHVASAGSNEAAIAADEAYFAAGGKRDGLYFMMYYPHNIHFLAVANADCGRFNDAYAAAQKVSAHAAPHVAHMAMMEMFVPHPIYVLVKFRKWDEVLAFPEPDAKALAGTHALWRFARGMAHAGKGDTAAAESEHARFVEERRNLPATTALSMFNKSDDILGIADAMLAAKLAHVKGDHARAAEYLRSAAGKDDALAYMEPPDWYMPPRETLGAVLLKSGDAAGAEKAFREDLARHARNPRSLFGLMHSLKAQGRDYEAEMVRQQFDSAWKEADTTLRMEDL